MKNKRDIIILLQLMFIKTIFHQFFTFIIIPPSQFFYRHVHTAKLAWVHMPVADNREHYASKVLFQCNRCKYSIWQIYKTETTRQMKFVNNIMRLHYMMFNVLIQIKCGFPLQCTCSIAKEQFLSRIRYKLQMKCQLYMLHIIRTPYSDEIYHEKSMLISTKTTSLSSNL